MVKSTLRTLFVILISILFCGMAEVHAQSPQLDLITDPELVLGFSETAPVQVRFSGPDGPISGTAVGFTPMSDTADTNLSQLRDTTDADGVAETLITGGNVPIDFDILISVPDDDTVVPLTVHVRVSANPGLSEAEYPGDFSSMQEAIDALADGGVLKVAKGRHFIEEPVFIIGKRVVIKGAGSGLRAKKGDKVKRPVTHLIGHPPRPVLDARHNVILPVERAEGLINAIAADVVVRDMRLSGFDAGIVTKDDRIGKAHSMMVTNVLITKTGRGIVAPSSGDITIESSGIQGTLWHGLVVFPPLPMINKALVKDMWIRNTGGAAVYFEDTFGIVSNGDLTGGLRGGVVCFECDLIVMNSHIHANYHYGIFLVLARNVPAILGNVIEDTRSDLFWNWGDGITSVLSKINVSNNQILDSYRAGLSNFGGHATISDTIFQCAAFYLQGEPFLGHKFTFENGGENYCGCPSAAGVCVAQSAGLQPPEPIAPIK